MGFGAKTEKVSRGSQATPFAEQLLRELSDQISSGGLSGLGTGISPHQRQAGDALGRYIESKENRPRGVLDTLAPLFADIRADAQQTLKRNIGDTRERASINGLDRLGTSGARLEVDAMDQILTSLSAELARIGAGAQLQDDQSFLQALGLLSGMGTQNLAPIFQLAGLGILPEEIIQTPGMGSQLLGGAMGFAGNVLGGPAGGIITEKLLGDK